MTDLIERDTPALRLPDGTVPSPRVLHLIEAARRQFMENGFDAVSIDSLARLTGVSKETIYRHFPDKTALLRAALASLRASFAASASGISRKAASPEATLTDYARIIQDATIDGGFLSATWLSIAIARTAPDLAAALQDETLAGLVPLQQKLTEIAGHAGKTSPIPLELAADFGSLAVEGARSLMGWPPPDDTERTQTAQRVAHLFLHGCGTAPSLAVPAVPGVSDDDLERPQAPGSQPAHIATLLAVARDHFCAHGYQGVSLDEIGNLARVGRGTLYRHFRNKAGLFEAAMLEAAQQLRILPPPLPTDCSPEAALAPFLANAAAALTSPAGIALHRTVIAEARWNPSLARQIYLAVRDPWSKALAEWLARKASDGAVRLSDPAWYARQLLTLATSGNRPFASNEAPDPIARSAAVKRAIATFLGGYMAAL